MCHSSRGSFSVSLSCKVIGFPVIIKLVVARLGKVRPVCWTFVMGLLICPHASRWPGTWTSVFVCPVHKVLFELTLIQRRYRRPFLVGVLKKVGTYYAPEQFSGGFKKITI